ncbi:hypothetical protein CAEBREN_03167 [Caenorhabditis brenneri]|uniref:Uncharacterized protein n=1 Tax=Caenorhabditis brenneri TaxID=135651 RepID=G0NT30_CAEBE|nr:hypothetical protein CAEBREN_03167 [Caenorhabditis brenneri]
MSTTAAPENDNGSSNQIGPPIELAPIIANYHFYNDLISGVSSIVLNLILLFVVTKRIESSTRIFQKVMCVSKLFDILFSLSYIMTAPVFTSIALKPNFSGLMIVNTGWQFNFFCSQLFLSAALILLTQQIFLAPWLYYFRYIQVCRKDGIKFFDVLIVITFNSVFQFFTSICFCYASVPTDSDIDLLKEAANKFMGTTSAFLLLSYTKQYHIWKERISQVVSVISALGYVLSLVLSTFVMIVCTIKINIKVRESRNMSANLLLLQKRANRILLTQFFCPLIFIQFPFYYSVLGPIVGMSQGLPTDLLPLLFAWTPVINTLVVFILNAEIRNALVRKQKRITVTSDVRRSVVKVN